MWAILVQFGIFFNRDQLRWSGSRNHYVSLHFNQLCETLRNFVKLCQNFLKFLASIESVKS